MPENPQEGAAGQGAAAETTAGAAATVGNPEESSSTFKNTELKDTGPQRTGPPLDMSFILDIPLKVTVEVGRTRLLVQELLQLGQGSVIELDKQMGEPFEVLVNEKLVARGEIVVVNDRFGVRLTDIISPTERVQSLG